MTKNRQNQPSADQKEKADSGKAAPQKLEKRPSLEAGASAGNQSLRSNTLESVSGSSQA